MSYRLYKGHEVDEVRESYGALSAGMENNLIAKLIKQNLLIQKIIP